MNFTKYTIVVSFLMLQLACSNETEKAATSSESASENPAELRISKSQFKAGEMKLFQIEKQAFTQYVECTGMVDVPPQNRAIISAVMGGYVKSSALLIGDKVKAGQPILTLENPEYAELQQQYLETKATINYLKVDFERQETLQAEKINSVKEFLKAKSDYEQAKAKLEGLAEKLRMISIDPSGITDKNISAKVQLYSPIDGRVSMVNISQGTYVDPSKPLMEIIALHHLHLELNVYEQDYMKLKVGQKILFSLPEAGEMKFNGEVHLIGNTIDPESRTIKVHGHLETDSVNFAVGMFIEAQIAISAQDFLAAPSDAIIKTENGNELLLLVEETETEYIFRKQQIKTGETIGNNTALLDYPEWKAENNYLKGGYHFIGESEGHNH